MRTPGRCTNLEGCWISASHRTVWLSVGEDFVCPNCRGNLSAPLPQARSFRAAKRAVVVGAVASMGLVVATFGMVKLSTVSWPGQSIAATVVQAPRSILAVAFSRKPALVQVAEIPDPVKKLTTSTESMAQDVAHAGPNSPFSMVLGDHHKLPPGPLMLYTSKGVATSRGTRAEQQRADAAMNQVHGALVTLVSQAVLMPRASTERPVELDVSVGRPKGPETDGEPVSLTWHHHSMVNVRRSGFLPAPAAATTSQASPDALAQICRIPSLMH